MSDADFIGRGPWSSQPRTVQRLKGSLSGTNLELTGDYNQRLVYQAIRTKGPITRNALIELTGLAKPTIAAIVRRLLSSDLVLETSRIYGGRGQPAVHLEINSEGCYAVGLHVDADRLALVVVDACGTPVRRTATDLPSTSGARVNSFVRRQFFEQTRNVRRERIIGLGIASSGFAAANDQEADSGNGVGLDLLSLSEIAPSLPIYIDSDLAAAAAGESLFGLGADFRSYYYILMDVVPVGVSSCTRGSTTERIPATGSSCSRMWICAGAARRSRPSATGAGRATPRPTATKHGSRRRATIWCRC